MRYENTDYANERWQGDHSPLPIWVRKKENGKWVPVRAHISALLDAHTRAIPGQITSIKYPDSRTISLLFRKAILPKADGAWRQCGIPSVFQSDRGRDFLSKSIMASLAKLHIRFDPDPPRYPNRKGKVEIFFRILDLGCLRLLPGHVEAIGKTEEAARKHVHELLTIQQLNQEIERWIIEEYYQRVHSETGQKPAEFWEESVRLRMPASEDELSLLLLKEDIERTVRNIGIEVKLKGEKHIYWSPDLVDYFRHRVRLAYNPEDMESAIVYCADTGKRICEAHDMIAENSKYDVGDIKAAKSRFRKGMTERMREYIKEIEVEDRRDTRKEEWAEARRLLEKSADDTVKVSEENDPEIMALLAKFRARDRGKN